MDQPLPLRRRERNPRLDDDFYGAAPPYEPGPPPRRHKSERHRPRPAPDVGAEDAYRHAPRRGGYGGRRDPEPYDLKPAGGSGRRPRSPPPYYTSEPSRPPRRERERERERDARREPRPSRHDRPPVPVDPYAREPPPRGYPSELREPPVRHHRDEPDRRARGERPLSPPDTRHRYRDGYAPAYGAAGRASPDPRARRARHMSPDPRPHARDAPSRRYGGDDDDHRHDRRRARSQGKPVTRGVSPPRGRGPPPATGAASTPAAKPSATRRNSMPANIVKKGATWWSNPLIQAGGKAALTAGAQAAMRSRGDAGSWLGPKGGRVAAAALGAALMDGFMGSKGSDDGGKRSRSRQR